MKVICLGLEIWYKVLNYHIKYHTKYYTLVRTHAITHLYTTITHINNKCVYLTIQVLKLSKCT